MKKYATESIRNIALVGHGDSGKTTLAEAMLFTSGAINRLGKVDEGNTVTDYDPEEVKRHISVNTALAPFEWKNHKINVVDTPGYADFIGEALSGLRVADAAAVVVDAVAGVEVQTERMWAAAEENNLARIGVINRLDRENSDFEAALTAMREAFGDSVVAVQVPVGKEHGFKGVVDLLEMKAYVTENSKTTVGEIPGDAADLAQSYRDRLMEKVAEADDALLEKYLEGGELSDDELKAGLVGGTASRALCPVFCVSGGHAIGVEPLLDGITAIVPSPAEKGAVPCSDSKSGEEKQCEPSASAPLAAFVFKTVADPYVGKLNLFRVYSGTLKADSAVYNSTKGKKERIGHVYIMHGKNQEEISEVVAGDIGAVPKLADTATGDTLCNEGANLVFKGVSFPEPVMSVAIEPKTKGEEDKLGTALNRLHEEDPTFNIRRDQDTHEMIVSGFGDTHLDVTMDRLKRKFGVEGVLSAPKIPYRETIRGTTQVQGRHKKQSGGRGQFGDVWLRLEPLPRGGGFEFGDEIFGGSVPQQYRPAVEKGVKEAMATGAVAGYPVVDVKVVLYDGSYHAVDSSEMAFKIAGSLALKKGVLDAKPVILEPIVKVEAIVPNEYAGDVMGDFSSKRGKILGMDPRGRNQAISALVPMAEMSKYATELRSITHGRGSYTMSFDHYEEVPSDVTKKLIEAAQAEQAAGH
ncbi:MAG: elongation factor G [Candidatus Aquicultorales bacterium]